MDVKSIGKVQLIFGMIVLILGVIGTIYSSNEYISIIGDNYLKYQSFTMLLFSVVILLLAVILVLQGLVNTSKKKNDR